MRACFVLLFTLACAGCAMCGDETSRQARAGEHDRWQLMDAHALGDGGTLLVRLRSPEGEVVSFDYRSPTDDLQRRVHVHLEPFDFRGLPESRVLERGSTEEQRYGRYLAEALAPHLKPEQLQARQQRFALSDEFLQAFYRWNDAKNANESTAAKDELKTEFDRARAAANAQPVTDADRSVRNAQAILHVIEVRRANPSFGVHTEFPYNVGCFEE